MDTYTASPTSGGTASKIKKLNRILLIVFILWVTVGILCLGAMDNPDHTFDRTARSQRPLVLNPGGLSH